jgi:AAA15 family ATPase/GTPase
LPKINAIELENFQTFGKKVVIPIRDLTLMFGPNGAGKSALFDALDILKVFLSDDWGTDHKNLTDLIDKSSRNSNTVSPSNRLGIGIQIFIDEDWSGEQLPEDRFTRFPQIHHWGISKDGDYPENFLNKNLYFFVNFEKIYGGWIISELKISLDSNRIIELIKDDPEKHPIIYIHEQDWISFLEVKNANSTHHHIHYLDNILSGRVEPNIGFLHSARRWFEVSGAGTIINLEMENAFSILLQQVIDFFKMTICEELKDMPLVKASRVVPDTKEVISIFSGESYNNKVGFQLRWSKLLENLDSIINPKDEFWKFLCQVVAQSNAENNERINDEWWELNYLQRINSLLREELFIENGYQLTGEVICTVPFSDFENYDIKNYEYYPKLVRLYLVDNQQRKLEISDVGSGIGYVLPVLASLVKDDISLIQQPELHLHPKLQSHLGEAIVKAVENKKYYRAFTIIETHSEHVLLRVMRLIKNSESRKEESIRTLSFDMVSVLYFEPMSSGETQVKRLRLAPDGQLIDRWPGGFFNERFRDIFDE